MRSSWLAGAFALTAALTGCQNASTVPTPTTAVTNEPSGSGPGGPTSTHVSTRSVLDRFDSAHLLTAAEVGAAYTERLKDNATAGSITNPPKEARVRFISPEELGPTRVACLQEQGIPAKLIDGLGYELGDVPDSQGAAVNLADYVCEARYPLHPQYLLRASPSAKGRAYDWMVNKTIPCLRRQGNTIPDAPAREVWIAAGADAWIPDDALMQQLGDRRAVQRALDACPGPKTEDMMEHPPTLSK